MNVIDTHCHASPVWFEPVETLLFHMDRHGVTHAVLTQLLGQFDNRYQEECVRKYPGRFTSVVAVDTDGRDPARQLHALADRGARGVRMRPSARCAGADPYALWRVAAERGLAVSCVGPAASFLAPTFAELLKAFPSVRVLAEHLCGWARPDCDRSPSTLDGIRRLAGSSNLFLKVPPLGQLAERGAALPPSGRTLDMTPAQIVLDLLDRYGPSRLCWGSDFPVVSSREGYGNALQWSLDLFESVSRDTRQQVFGATAREVFSICE